MTDPGWGGSDAWDGADPWPGPHGGGGGGSADLTVTPEPFNVPPRVRLDVSDPTASVSSVTITRLDPDGRSRKVRTSDDGPLPLNAGAATIFDYEAPYGQPVTYSTVGGPEVTATLDVADVWLNHPFVPARSVRVSLRAGSNDDESWNLDQGIFQILERDDPIIATSGARLLPASALLVSVESREELVALRQVLADGAVLLLNVPPSAGVGLDTCYIAVGTAVPRRRPNDFGDSGSRDVELPYQTVRRPAGGTQAGISWDSIATVGDDDYTAAAGSQFTTWAQVAAAYDSWAALASP